MRSKKKYNWEMKEKNYLYHVVAICVSAVWGITFISTKTLINYGLTPTEIFTLRFAIAYVGMWLIAPRPLFCRSGADEFKMLLGGVTGGSLYFLSENYSLSYTLATNVSFIVCTTPLVTALLLILLDRNEHLTRNLLVGSLISLVGVGLVVYNGSFILKLSPKGDILALVASVVWAFYGYFLKDLFKRYDINFITRKVFFYGLVTILPVYFFVPWQCPLSLFRNPLVIGNLLFLSVLASLICYALWNHSLRKLGTVKATNYIYLNPFFTLLGSFLFLNEPFTWMAFAGVIFIVSGMYMAARR